MEHLLKIEYCEESPSGLVWKTHRFESKIGTPVGYINTINKNTPVKRWQTMINRVAYLCHRLVWELHNGAIPDGMQIDHIDRNPLNNKINNLRLVTNKINCQNKGKYKNNKTQVKGVSTWYDRKRRVMYYCAHWCTHTGESKSKKFSIVLYGDELAFKMACDYREQQIAILNKTGANYII